MEAARQEVWSLEKFRAIQARHDFLNRSILPRLAQKYQSVRTKSRREASRLQKAIVEAKKERDKLSELYIGENEKVEKKIAALRKARMTQLSSALALLQKREILSSRLQRDAWLLGGKMLLAEAELKGGFGDFNDARMRLRNVENEILENGSHGVFLEIPELYEAMARSYHARGTELHKAAEYYEKAADEYAETLGLGGEASKRCALFAVDCWCAAGRRSSAEKTLKRMKSAGVLPVTTGEVDSVTMNEVMGNLYNQLGFHKAAAERYRRAYDKDVTQTRCLQAVDAYLEIYGYSEARTLLEEAKEKLTEDQQIKKRLKDDVLPKFYE
jgi:tetratricopeptide (TPR) repeat protein